MADSAGTEHHDKMLPEDREELNPALTNSAKTAAEVEGTASASEIKPAAAVDPAIATPALDNAQSIKPEGSRDGRDNRNGRGDWRERRDRNRNRERDGDGGGAADDDGDRPAKRQRGQNKGRKFQSSYDDIRLCPYISVGQVCKYEDGGAGDDGRDGCRFEHSVAKYMAAKPADNEGICPVYAKRRSCDAGFRCRWLSSHVDKVDPANADSWRLTYEVAAYGRIHGEDADVENVVDAEVILRLRRRQYPLTKSDAVLKEQDKRLGNEDQGGQGDRYELPFVVEQKRKIDWSGRKVLAPLTTVGNMPFRRICRDYGADATYGEMALSLPLLGGNRSDWALSRSHKTERDTRNGRKGLFGMQLAGPKPFMNIKIAEVLGNELKDSLDFIDLNCGCPIDLVFNQGAGSALLDQQGKLNKILRGMSAVSGQVPITCKIRTGVADGHHTAGKLLYRLQREAPVDMVCLHGRSRRQRYSREADWGYIAECAQQITEYKRQHAADADSHAHMEQSADSGPSSRIVNAWGYAPGGQMSFLGNGDIYNYQDYYDHLEHARVDGCMIARGALIKPWVFEEIDRRQSIDYSSNDRLAMLKKFCDHGLDYWGADQMGVDKTRRFLLEFLSFHQRYIPLGLFPEDSRPTISGVRGGISRNSITLKPEDKAIRGQVGEATLAGARDELELLLGSDSAEDWVKLSEQLLGKAKDSFKFVPKHKSNAHSNEAGMVAEG